MTDRRDQFIAYISHSEDDTLLPVEQRRFQGHLDPLSENDDDDWAQPFGIDDVTLTEALEWAHQRARQIVLCLGEVRERRFSAGEERVGFSGQWLPVWDDEKHAWW